LIELGFHLLDLGIVVFFTFFFGVVIIFCLLILDFLAIVLLANIASIASEVLSQLALLLTAFLLSLLAQELCDVLKLFRFLSPKLGGCCLHLIIGLVHTIFVEGSSVLRRQMESYILLQI